MARVIRLSAQHVEAAPDRSQAVALDESKRQIATSIEASLTGRQRRTMEARAALLNYCNAMAGNGRTLLAVYEATAHEANTGLLPPELQALVPVANDRSGGQARLSARTLRRWATDRKKIGTAGVAPQKTRERGAAPAWMDEFLRYYARPMKPSIADAMRQWQEDQPEKALPSYSAVRAALDKLSHHERARGREGRLALKARQAFVKRDTSDLMPASVYAGDGTTWDREVEHPIHGRPFKPEITAIIDAHKVAKVSTSIGLRYQDVAAIFAQGGQSGIAYKDLDTFGVLAAKVSTAWDVSAKEAAQMLAEVRAQTGKTIPDLEKFADKVNFLGDISAAAEKDVGHMYQRAAAGMAAAGVGEDQSLAMMTALRGVGMQDEVASRFLTFFSGRLRTATSWDKGPIAALKQIGMTAKEVEMGMQLKPMETILKFLDKASHAKNAVGTMKGILGGEWFDEGLRFAQAAPEITRLLDALSKGGWKGSMQQALDIELGTTEAKIKKLTAAATDLMTVWAKPITHGLIDPVVEWATKTMNEEREAIKRSEDSKKAVKPKGLSSDDYETVHGLNRVPPPVITRTPTMALTEGNTPHIAQTPGTGSGFGRSVLDVSQFAEDAKKVTSASGSAYEALQNLNTTVTPSINVMNAIDALNTLEKKAAAVDAALKALGTHGVPGAPHAPSAPSTPLAPLPGKQSGLSTGIIFDHDPKTKTRRLILPEGGTYYFGVGQTRMKFTKEGIVASKPIALGEVPDIEVRTK